jgi:hypothetical protein
VNTQHRPKVSCDNKLRAIAYSMDTLVPGFYVWLGPVKFQVGGCEPDDDPYRYPGTIHSRFGIALVLPGYHIFTTYRDSFDPPKTRN